MNRNVLGLISAMISVLIFGWIGNSRFGVRGLVGGIAIGLALGAFEIIYFRVAKK